MITSKPLPGPDLFPARDTAKCIAESDNALTSHADEARAGEVLSREMSLFDLDEALCLLMDSAVSRAENRSGPGNGLEVIITPQLCLEMDGGLPRSEEAELLGRHGTALTGCVGDRLPEGQI